MASLMSTPRDPQQQGRSNLRLALVLAGLIVTLYAGALAGLLKHGLGNVGTAGNRRYGKGAGSSERIVDSSSGTIHTRCITRS